MITTENALLIHHWDTDGICSAKILLEHFKHNIRSNMTPILGNYYLTDQELHYARAFDTVIIADMALPEKNIHELTQSAEVIIFDHHIQPPLDVKLHQNPVSQGASHEAYPSTSYVVNRYLGGTIDLFVVLGAVGDREDKLKTNPLFWPFVEAYLAESRLSFSDLLQMARLLDSIYRVGDKKGVEDAPYLLLQNPGPTYILNQKTWNQNVIQLEQEIKKLLRKTPRELDGVLIQYIHTSYHVISQITRMIAWKESQDTVVVNTHDREGLIQLYVRTIDKDLTPLIRFYKLKRYSAGGKKDVMGVIIPKEEKKRIIASIVNYLTS